MKIKFTLTETMQRTAFISGT